MSKTLILLGALLLAPAAIAQSALDFDVWMQHIDRRSQSVLLHLRNRDAAPAAADARELERLYLLMERYYEQQSNVEDAVIASYEGRQRAARAAVAAEQGEFSRAWDDALWIAQDCRNCHVKYKPIRQQQAARP